MTQLSYLFTAQELTKCAVVAGVAAPGAIELLIVGALILIAIDFYLQSDYSTLIAYALLSTVVSILLPAPLSIKVLTGIALWFGFAVLHYTIWRKYVLRFVNTRVAPDRFQTGARGLVGARGVVKSLEGETLVEVGGDLWRFECLDDLQDGDIVIVASANDDTITVTPATKGD